MSIVYIRADVLQRVSKWLPAPAQVQDADQERYYRIFAALSKTPKSALSGMKKTERLELEASTLVSAVDVFFGETILTSADAAGPLELESQTEASTIAVPQPASDEQSQEPLQSFMSKRDLSVLAREQKPFHVETMSFFTSQSPESSEPQAAAEEVYVTLDMSKIAFEQRRAFWIDFYGIGITEAEAFLRSVPEEAVPAMFQKEDELEFRELAESYAIQVHCR